MPETFVLAGALRLFDATLALGSGWASAAGSRGGRQGSVKDGDYRNNACRFGLVVVYLLQHSFGMLVVDDTLGQTYYC